MTRIAHCTDPARDGWFAMDHRIIRPCDGSQVWVRIRKQVFFDGEGENRRPARAMLAAIDVTPERIAEQEVRQSEAFIRGVLNAVPNHIAVLDAKE